MSVSVVVNYCRLYQEVEACAFLITDISRLSLAGEFGEVDQYLLALPIHMLPPSVLVTALSITYHARDHLRVRKSFRDKCEEQLRTQLGDQRTDNLLRYR
jgi:hypothetical protein